MIPYLLPSVLIQCVKQTILQGVIHLLYDELENENVSRWGCEAIASLAYKNVTNQGKLGTLEWNELQVLET